MEVMYALPRWQAQTCPLSEVFPSAFVEEFYRVRQNPGHSQPLQIPVGDAYWRNPYGERSDRSARHKEVPCDRKADHHGRHHGARRSRSATLSQADKLSSIGLLAAGVAHEVNTPLGRDFLLLRRCSQKQLQGDAQKSGLMEKITRQTFRASEIVNNLLNFSRTSGNRIHRGQPQQGDFPTPWLCSNTQFRRQQSAR